MARKSRNHGLNGWPQSVYAGGNEEWVEYLRQAYYLLGMLWAVDAGDQAIAALCEVGRHQDARGETMAPGSASKGFSGVG